MREGYVSFLGKIRNVYPGAHIVLALGGSILTEDVPHNRWHHATKAAVRIMQERGNCKDYSYLEFGDRGWGHPGKQGNIEMAHIINNHSKAPGVWDH